MTFDVRGCTFYAQPGSDASRNGMLYGDFAVNLRVLGGTWYNLEPITYTQAQVTAISGKSVTIKPTAGFSSAIWNTGFGWWNWYNQMVDCVDSETLMSKPACAWHASGTRSAGSQAGTLVLGMTSLSGMAVGDIITRGPGPNGPSIGTSRAPFLAENCQGMSFEGMTTNIKVFGTFGGASDGRWTLTNCRLINGPNPAGDSIGQALGYLNLALTKTSWAQAKVYNGGGTLYQSQGSRSSMVALRK